MEFYISPDKTDELTKKIDRMFKHFPVVPNVVFSPVEKIIVTTNEVYGGNSHITKQKVFAIKVTIDDIIFNDWVLVATVNYALNSLLVGDAKYFRYIPEQYGLDYMKCDHCGNIHHNRVESHILHNPKTGEWMQVGSSCINKIFDHGKYLNNLIIKLYNTIIEFGGCEESDWCGGWIPSKKYLEAAVDFDEAMAFCLGYMKEHGEIWRKASHDDFGHKIGDGTNDDLISVINNGGVEPIWDELLFGRIHNYFETMEYGDADGNGLRTLTQKIIDGVKNEVIMLKEMYLAWFAIMNYKNYLNSGAFEEKINALNIMKGIEYNFYGKLDHTETFETYDWRGNETYGLRAFFKDANNGLVFTKDISWMGAIDKYKDEDGNYRFTGTIKFIAYKKQQIGFGGRLRATKPQKKSKK